MRVHAYKIEVFKHVLACQMESMLKTEENARRVRRAKTEKAGHSKVLQSRCVGFSW